MNSKISMTLAVAAAVLSIAAAAAPAQAATRLMYSSLEGFEFRCENHGGVFGQEGNVVGCQTPTVAVACEFTAARQAMCEWPGIENQFAVIRVIGTLPINTQGAFGSNGNSGNVGHKGGGGGFQGPKDFSPAPQNDPNPNFNGPKDFQMAP